MSESTPDTLCRMLYASRSSLGVNRADYIRILETSRLKNAKLNITGVLCAGGGHFVQVLEGPQDKVLRLYTTILDDPRHYDCILVGINPIRERLFSEWAMGYIANEPEVMEGRRRTLIEQWQQQSESSRLLPMMREFLAQIRAQP